MIWRFWCWWRHRDAWERMGVISSTHYAFRCKCCRQLWIYRFDTEKA